MKNMFKYLITLFVAMLSGVAMAQETPQDSVSYDDQIMLIEEASVEYVVDTPEQAEEEATLSVAGSLGDFFGSMGISKIVMEWGAGNWKYLVMIAIGCLLLYLAIVKQFEPLLLLPIAMGMILTNIPDAGMFHSELFAGGHVHWAEMAENAGLLDYLYLGVKLGIYPCLIFVGVGAMTDFGPLLANPKSLLLGAAAQVGIFVTFLSAIAMGFTPEQAASIGIIGGADGPTAIFLTSKLAPELLGPIAVAAYSYMALVPVIQPPIMRALTSKKEREIEKIINTLTYDNNPPVNEDGTIIEFDATIADKSNKQYQTHTENRKKNKN